MKKGGVGGSGNGRELGGGEYAGVWQAVQRQPRIARLHAVHPHPFHFPAVGACAGASASVASRLVSRQAHATVPKCIFNTTCNVRQNVLQ